MKRPSFQFYPGDWQVNSNLRRCTHAEKGAWVDVLVLMHDQDEYGILRWPLKEIAQSIGAPLALLRGLVAKGVLKGGDDQLVEGFIYVPRSGRKDGEPVTLVAPQAGPIWYSSRMVKDEHVRTIRGEASRFGADEGDVPKPPPKSAPKPPFGDGSSSSSSSSPSGDRSPSGSRLPPDWVLPDDWRAWAREKRPDLDPDEVAATFADFWHSKPGKDARKTDWLMTWRNWVRGQRAGKSPAQNGSNYAGVL